MHIALTGSSGFIGSAIARRLHGSGHTVAGLVRPASRRDHIQPYISRFVVGDQTDESVWPDLLDGADCIIHNSIDWSPIREGRFENHLRTNLLGSLKLLRASAPRQFIFISTIAVHHDIRPRWGGRTSAGGLVDEDHPLRPDTDYGACKAAVEAHLWAEHYRDARHTSAIRPCAVYGLDPNPERSIGHKIIAQLRDNPRFARPGGGKFVHVDDVAAAAAAIVAAPAAAGRPFNLVDCYARWADWAQMAADLMGIEAQIDFSSPTKPKNTFTKDAAQSLGIPLNRGHDGIRDHLRKLIQAMP